MSAKSSALVEMIMVMSLLTLLGAAVCALIITGAETEKRVISDRDAHMDALVALSYINVKLRQNDVQGGIAVNRLELTGENAIVLKDDTYDYDMWIFYYDGKLMECIVDPGGQPSVQTGFRVADVEGMDIEMDGGKLTATVFYSDNSGQRSMSATACVRSNQY